MRTAFATHGFTEKESQHFPPVRIPSHTLQVLLQIFEVAWLQNGVHNPWTRSLPFWALRDSANSLVIGKVQWVGTSALQMYVWVYGTKIRHRTYARIAWFTCLMCCLCMCPQINSAKPFKPQTLNPANQLQDWETKHVKLVNRSMRLERSGLTRV